MSTSSPSEDERRTPPERVSNRSETLAAEIVAADTHGSECTIYPAGLDGIDLMTRWITAAEGSFVSLEDAR